ncbi:MAG: hypothetical protein J0M04_10865 [Verrucomicrobia bacterium]|nr:hypothetical protein [Verrucomicrobiota bacterium]
MPRHARLIPLLLLAVAATLRAAPDRTCRILFLAAPEGAPETLLLFDGTSSRPVELPRMNLSPVYPLPSGDITLRMLAQAPSDAKPADPAAPSAKVAASVTDLYLLVTADPANRAVPVKLQVINAGADVFHKGQMLWFNLTPNRINGRLGDRGIALAPQSRAILDSPASGNDDYEVNLTYTLPENPKTYPLCETRWHNTPDSRGLFFVFTQPGVRTPRVVGFPDTRPNPESAK